VVRRKVVQVAILVMLITSLSFTTTAAFAYWREVSLENIVVVQVIGDSGELIVTDLNSELQGQLVPEGRAIFVGEIEEAVFTYTVGVSKDLINSMNLNISATNVLINNDDTYSHLIEIEIMGSVSQTVVELFREVVTITVRIRLIEPIDLEEAIELGLDLERVNVEDSKAAFETIRGQEITFGLRFELQPRENE
jgi:hypothetical protein